MAPTARVNKRKMKDRNEDEVGYRNNDEEKKDEVSPEPSSPLICLPSLPSILPSPSASSSPPSSPASSTRGIPTEILRNTLKYLDPSSLSQCMRVSKTFYALAGTLLYSNVIINEKQPISKVVGGCQVVDKPTNGSQAAINLKSHLLLLVQQLTIVTHTCNPSDSTSNIFHNKFPAESFSGLKTIVIIPYASCHKNEPLCGKWACCPILHLMMPQKVVIHNSRMHDRFPGLAEWQTCESDLFVFCSTLTHVVEETNCGMVRWAKQGDIVDIFPSRLKHFRIIVNKTPVWLDKVAHRKTSDRDVASVDDLSTHTLAPLMHGKRIPITIYLFQPLCDKQVNDLKLAIDFDLDRYGGVSNCRPSYCIKSLSDYIAEGLEDEFLVEELQYWREENSRRLKVGGGESCAGPGNAQPESGAAASDFS